MKAIRELAKRGKKYFSDGCGQSSCNSSQDLLSSNSFIKQTNIYKCSSSCLFSNSAKDSSSSSSKSSSSDKISGKSNDSKISKESSLFTVSSSSKGSSSSQECECLRVDKCVGPSHESPKPSSHPHPDCNPCNYSCSVADKCLASSEVSGSVKCSKSSEDSCESSSSSPDTSLSKESSSKSVGTQQDPKQIAKKVTVPGLSKACFRPPAQPVPLSMALNKGGPYKNTEYFGFHETTFYESQIELSEYRLPQPSALKKEDNERDDTNNTNNANK